MKWTSKVLIVFFLFVNVSSFSLRAQTIFSLKDAIQNAEGHYLNAIKINADSIRIPRSIWPNGTLRNVNSSDWCSGFFGGSLWLLYELNHKDAFKKSAQKWTLAVEKEQFNKTTHDLGFMMFNPFGNGYKMTKDTGYRNVIIQSAKSLATRFKPAVGVIKSWDNSAWQYPVIIDNMMNLELLFEASKLSGDNKFRDIAIRHADHDMLHHFRKDYSSFHVVDYDSLNGNPIKKQTHQGINDSSSWARGQAWGLYGFTVMYRYTKDARYLNQAKGIAAFVLNHPNLPEDKVPYWDFNDPKIPNTYRDASSAAIIASSLLELTAYVDKKQGKFYFSQAEKILATLSSEKFTAKVGSNNNFILMHCVGNLPSGKDRGEIDASISYADYYYIESLLRYKNCKSKFTSSKK